MWRNSSLWVLLGKGVPEKNSGKNKKSALNTEFETICLPSGGFLTHSCLIFGEYLFNQKTVFWHSIEQTRYVTAWKVIRIQKDPAQNHTTVPRKTKDTQIQSWHRSENFFLEHKPTFICQSICKPMQLNSDRLSSKH